MNLKSFACFRGVKKTKYYTLKILNQIKSIVVAVFFVRRCYDNIDVRFLSFLQTKFQLLKFRADFSAWSGVLRIASLPVIV